MLKDEMQLSGGMKLWIEVIEYAYCRTSPRQ